MSDKTNNYMEETRPLFRLLRTEAFRFIIVRYNHYSLVNRLKEDLLAYFPERPQNTIDARNADYRMLVDSYYKAERGFFFVENFEEVLANPEIYSGLNQRRDKLALYPIALIVFISSSTDELFARQIMEKMPDLWSFRSLMLDLKVDLSNEYHSTDWNQFLLSEPEPEVLIASTLGGSSSEKKEQELNRLLKRVEEIPENGFNLLRYNYDEIARLYVDLNKYDEAIEFYHRLEKMGIEIDDKSGLGTIYNNIGLIYASKRDWNKALEYFMKDEKITIEEGNKIDLASTYINMGLSFSNNGEQDKAIEYYKKAEGIWIFEGDKSGIAISNNNIGRIYSKEGKFDKALEHYLKSEKIWLEVGDKSNFGLINNNIGALYFHMGQLTKALEYYLKSMNTRNELGDKKGLATTCYNLGITYLKNGDNIKGNDYLILAGFIATNQGMKNELSQMSLVLDPIIQELGQEKFMEEGQKLYHRMIKKKNL